MQLRFGRFQESALELPSIFKIRNWPLPSLASSADPAASSTTRTSMVTESWRHLETLKHANGSLHSSQTHASAFRLSTGDSPAYKREEHSTGSFRLRSVDLRGCSKMF